MAQGFVYLAVVLDWATIYANQTVCDGSHLVAQLALHKVGAEHRYRYDHPRKPLLPKFPSLSVFIFLSSWLASGLRAKSIIDFA
jgi:hypothetical protein